MTTEDEVNENLAAVADAIAAAGLKHYKVVERVVTYCTTIVAAQDAEQAIELTRRNADIDWSYDTEYDESLGIEATEVTA